MIHQIRIAIEKKFGSEANTNEILMMKLFGARESMLNFHLTCEAWAVNTAPWNIDFFALSVPIDLDAENISGVGSEALAIAAANDKIDIAQMLREVNLAINDMTSIQPHDRWPTDATNSDDFRTIVDEYFVSAIHQKIKLIVPIVNATGIDPLNPDTVSTFLRRRFRFSVRRPFFYAKPSVFILASRQPLHETVVTGPWDAAGAGTATEQDWKALTRPEFRSTSNIVVNDNTIKYHIPYYVPLDDGFQYTAEPDKVLNVVGRGHMTIGTNHPLATKIT